MAFSLKGLRIFAGREFCGQAPNVKADTQVGSLDAKAPRQDAGAPEKSQVEIENWLVVSR